MSNSDARVIQAAQYACDGTEGASGPLTSPNRRPTGRPVYQVYHADNLTIRCNDQPFLRFHDVEIDGWMIYPKLSISQYAIFRVLLQHRLQLTDGRSTPPSRAYVTLADILSAMGVVSAQASDEHGTRRLVQRQVTQMRRKIGGYFDIGCATVGKQAYGYYLQPAQTWPAGPLGPTGPVRPVPGSPGAHASLGIVRTA